MMELEIIWGEIKIRILPKIARLKIARSKASYSTRPRMARYLGNFYITSVKRQIAANIFISLLFPLLHPYDGNRNYLGRNKNSNSS